MLKSTGCPRVHWQPSVNTTFAALKIGPPCPVIHNIHIYTLDVVQAMRHCSATRCRMLLAAQRHRGLSPEVPVLGQASVLPARLLGLLQCCLELAVAPCGGLLLTPPSCWLLPASCRVCRGKPTLLLACACVHAELLRMAGLAAAGAGAWLLAMLLHEGDSSCTAESSSSPQS